MVVVKGLDRVPGTALEGMPDKLWQAHATELQEQYDAADASIKEAGFEAFAARFVDDNYPEETTATRQWAERFRADLVQPVPMGWSHKRVSNEFKVALESRGRVPLMEVLTTAWKLHFEQALEPTLAKSIESLIRKCGNLEYVPGMTYSHSELKIRTILQICGNETAILEPIEKMVKYAQDGTAAKIAKNPKMPQDRQQILRDNVAKEIKVLKQIAGTLSALSPKLFPNGAAKWLSSPKMLNSLVCACRGCKSSSVTGTQLGRAFEERVYEWTVNKFAGFSITPNAYVIAKPRRAPYECKLELDAVVHSASTEVNQHLVHATRATGTTAGDIAYSIGRLKRVINRMDALQRQVQPEKALHPEEVCRRKLSMWLAQRRANAIQKTNLRQSCGELHALIEAKASDGHLHEDLQRVDKLQQFLGEVSTFKFSSKQEPSTEVYFPMSGVPVHVCVCARREIDLIRLLQRSVVRKGLIIDTMRAAAGALFSTGYTGLSEDNIDMDQLTLEFDWPSGAIDYHADIGASRARIISERMQSGSLFYWRFDPIQ